MRWSPLRLLRLLRPPRRLRFTRDGRYFVAITIGIGLAAVNTGNNLLYLLLGWLFSVILASGALSDASLRGLWVSRMPPGRVFANRPFLMEIAVENLKGQLASYSIEIEDLVEGRPLDKKCYFLKIPSGRTQRTSYRHTFPRRGLHRFDGFRVGTKFPFALFHKSRVVSSPGELVVYPTVYPVALPVPRARYRGETSAARLGRRGEFFGLREYRSGDDRRDIHWRSTARAGRLMVREYEEEAERRATILCDNALPDDDSVDPDRAADALEHAISLAASLASTYLANGYSVALIARGDQVPMAAGQLQQTRILHTLALLETVTDETPFAAAVDTSTESILVVPRGIPAEQRPAAVGHVLAGKTAAGAEP